MKYMLLFAAEQKLVSFFCSPIHSRFLTTCSCPGLDLSCFCMGLKHCLFAPLFRAVMPCTPSVRFMQLNPAPCCGCVPCVCEHYTLFSTTIHINREEYNPGFCFHAGNTSTEEESPSTTLLPEGYLHLLLSIDHVFMRGMVNNKDLSSFLSLFESEYPPSEDLNCKSIPSASAWSQFIFCWVHMTHILFFNKHLLQAH